MAAPKYSTYILGKDDYEINPLVKAIRVTDVKPTGVGYEITCRGPLDLMLEMFSQQEGEE